MSIETELKLLFASADQNLLIDQLNRLSYANSKATKQLNNTYFDTLDLQLRRWDMGLRVRTNGDCREQTIKTAGQVINGLHSRPEYNTDIDRNFPKLCLFPNEIWPNGADITKLQANLQAIFETNFVRRCWHIETDNSLVEVALDIGEICAKDHTLPICELELELLKGEVQSLFKLAEQIAKWLPVQAGQASKAQRGYQLAAQL